jgi:hypothetical protein
MRRIGISRLAIFTTAFFAALLLSGCEQKNINEIKADPGRYAHREVAVVGNVVQSVSLLGHGAYEVDDGTGRLWVVSQTGVPRKGARVAVRGTIRDAYDLGSFVRLPEKISAGMVLMEREHRAKF